MNFSFEEKVKKKANNDDDGDEFESRDTNNRLKKVQIVTMTV